MEKTGRKKTTIILVAIVWLFVFCWGLFFTSGVNFFFEDFHFLHLDKENSLFEVNPHPTLRNTMFSIVKEFFSPKQLFRAGFAASLNDRPYMFLSNDLLSIVFKDSLIFYRTFRAAVLAVIGVLIFLLIRPASLLLAFLSVIWLSSSGQVWTVLVGASDVNLYAQLGMIVSVSIFLQLLKNNNRSYKKLLMPYLLILLASQYAVLSKGDGRYLAVIFFLTFAFFKKEQLRYHWPMLSVLFLAEVPVLGYIAKLFTGLPLTPIDIGSHSQTSLVKGISSIVNNRQFPIIALGKLSLALLAFTALAQLLLLIFNRKKIAFLKDNQKYILLRERVFFFMLYFFSSFIIISVSKNFSYSGPYSLDFSETMCFITPFIIFLCYYLAFVSHGMVLSRGNIFIAVSAILLICQIVLFELPRLNRFRGAWGNYVCSLGNAEKYINNSSDNAMALYINTMPYKPFVFGKSNNKVIINNSPADNNPFCDLNYIESKFKEGYKDIFVVNSYGELRFRGQAQKAILAEKAEIDGDSGDLYDRLKNLLRRPSKKIAYVYHFILK